MLLSEDANDGVDSSDADDDAEVIVVLMLVEDDVEDEVGPNSNADSVREAISPPKSSIAMPIKSKAHKINTRYRCCLYENDN